MIVNGSVSPRPSVWIATVDSSHRPSVGSAPQKLLHADHREHSAGGPRHRQAVDSTRRTPALRNPRSHYRRGRLAPCCARGPSSSATHSSSRPKRARCAASAAEGPHVARHPVRRRAARRAAVPCPGRLTPLGRRARRRRVRPGRAAEPEGPVHRRRTAAAAQRGLPQRQRRSRPTTRAGRRPPVHGVHPRRRVQRRLVAASTRGRASGSCVGTASSTSASTTGSVRSAGSTSAPTRRRPSIRSSATSACATRSRRSSGCARNIAAFGGDPGSGDAVRGVVGRERGDDAAWPCRRPRGSSRAPSRRARRRTRSTRPRSPRDGRPSTSSILSRLVDDDDLESESGEDAAAMLHTADPVLLAEATTQLSAADARRESRHHQPRPGDRRGVPAAAAARRVRRRHGASDARSSSGRTTARGRCS